MGNDARLCDDVNDDSATRRRPAFFTRRKVKAATTRFFCSLVLMKTTTTTKTNNGIMLVTCINEECGKVAPRDKSWRKSKVIENADICKECFEKEMEALGMRESYKDDDDDDDDDDDEMGREGKRET